MTKNDQFVIVFGFEENEQRKIVAMVAYFREKQVTRMETTFLAR